MDPIDFVKKVGKGKTLSADLSRPEAEAAFHALLDGAFAPAQFGAFLQALRIKELTQDELDALANVFRARLRPLDPLAGAAGLVLNLASDTRRKGGLASLLAAHLLRRAGVAVGVVRSAPVLQGNRESFDRTWEWAALLEPSGPALPGPVSHAVYAPAPIPADCGDLVSGLSALDELRSQLGFRSCLHTAEKLVNPWPAAPMMLGISHKHYALRMGAALAALGLRGKILLGNHGTPDLVLHKETGIVSVDARGVREESVSPAQLGLEIPSDIYSLGKFPQWGEWLSAMAPGGAVRDNGLRRALQYHVAVMLWAAGAAEDPAQGLAAARRAIPTLFE